VEATWQRVFEASLRQCRCCKWNLKETSVFSAISLISVVLSMAFGILLGMIK